MGSDWGALEGVDEATGVVVGRGVPAATNFFIQNTIRREKLYPNGLGIG
jgi:hypothetical protein